MFQRRKSYGSGLTRGWANQQIFIPKAHPRDEESVILTARSISSSKIASLDHEILDNTMELASFVPVTLLKRASALACRQSVDLQHCVYDVRSTSPVARATKFCTVRGATSPNRPITILPTSCPPTVMSKNTCSTKTPQMKSNTPDSLALCVCMWLYTSMCVCV